MRVLLTNMPYAQSATPIGYRNTPRGDGFTVVWGPSPHLGLLYCAAVLREAGHELHYRDGAFTSMAELIQAISSLQIDVLGVSVVAPMAAKNQRQCARLKRLFPSLTILGGGPHSSLVPEQAALEMPAIDALCTGDGEVIFPRMLQALAEGRPLAGMAGVVTLVDGEPVVGPPAPQVHDLDSLPLPARDLVDLHRFRPSIGHFKQLPNTTMVASRGCPYRCTFCVAANDFRQRSPESVLAEIDHLVQDCGIRDILFYDEDLPRNREWMVRVCEGLIERDYDLVWSGNARVDRVDPALLRLMRKAGCWKLLMGLETGSPGTLRRMAKDFTLDQARASVAAATEAGIAVFGTFIFGAPGETYEEALATIDYAVSLRHVEFAKFLNFTPFPGTPFWDRLEKHGRLVDPSLMQMNHISFVPHSMTIEQLQDLHRRATHAFYRRPSYVARRLARIRSLEDIKYNLAGFRSFAMY